jgi:hypothetical protein
MYGRADGMPSFQLTVAVCACNVSLVVYILLSGHDIALLASGLPVCLFACPFIGFLWQIRMRTGVSIWREL